MKLPKSILKKILTILIEASHPGQILETNLKEVIFIDNRIYSNREYQSFYSDKDNVREFLKELNVPFHKIVGELLLNYIGRAYSVKEAFELMHDDVRVIAELTEILFLDDIYNEYGIDSMNTHENLMRALTDIRDSID